MCVYGLGDLVEEIFCSPESKSTVKVSNLGECRTVLWNADSKNSFGFVHRQRSKKG